MADSPAPSNAATPSTTNDNPEQTKDIPASTSGPASPANSSPSNAAEQARLRRERREAKIRAGGSARLGKITSMGGRPATTEDGKSGASGGGTTGSPSTTPSGIKPTSSSSERATRRTSTTATDGDSHEDPAEVDISQHFSPSPGNASTMAEQTQDIMRLLQQRTMWNNLSQSRPQTPQGRGQEEAQDPMAQLFSQLMGGSSPMGDGDDTGGPTAGLPPALAQSFGGGGAPPSNPNGTTPRTLERDTTSIWRIIHAISAFTLGIYIVFFSASKDSFTGTSISRIKFAPGTEEIHMGLQPQQSPPKLFWMFATLELILQSTRFFMERGRLPGTSARGAGGGGVGGIGGVLSTVAQFLPHPYGEYVRVAIRYGIMASTVVADALVVVFVLGCVAWWRGVGGMEGGVGKK
ncbi:MAG: hypothetical protein M1823_004420, partial [Watsoniomyces obsoletus]